MHTTWSGPAVTATAGGKSGSGYSPNSQKDNSYLLILIYLLGLQPFVWRNTSSTLKWGAGGFLCPIAHTHTQRFELQRRFMHSGVVTAHKSHMRKLKRTECAEAIYLLSIWKLVFLYFLHTNSNVIFE